MTILTVETAIINDTAIEVPISTTDTVIRLSDIRINSQLQTDEITDPLIQAPINAATFAPARGGSAITYNPIKFYWG